MGAADLEENTRREPARKQTTKNFKVWIVKPQEIMHMMGVQPNAAVVGQQVVYSSSYVTDLERQTQIIRIGSSRQVT